MTLTVRELAQGVYDLLKVYSGKEQPKFTKYWKAKYAIAELPIGEPQVNVKALTEVSEKNTRSTVMDDNRVCVTVIAHCSDTDNERMDELVDFIQELKELVKFQSIGGSTWQSTEHDPIVDEESFEQVDLFVSVFIVNYRITQ